MDFSSLLEPNLMDFNEEQKELRSKLRTPRDYWRRIKEGVITRIWHFLFHIFVILEMISRIMKENSSKSSVETELGQLSPQKQKTVKLIELASQDLLSVILIVVGDGPWCMTWVFVDNIPARSFDNFQFVIFTDIMSKNVSQTRKEFALASLMNVPLQYEATPELGILGQVSSKSPGRFPLPLPPGSFNVDCFDPMDIDTPDFDPMDVDPPAPPGASSEEQYCPICFTNPKDMAFGCGHQTCRYCGPRLDNCPICRRPIDIRIRLY